MAAESPDRGARPTLLAVAPVAPWPVTNGYGLRVAELLQDLIRRWRVVLVTPVDRGTPPPATAVDRVVAAGGNVNSSTFLPWQYDMSPIREAVRRAVAEERPEVALVWSGTESLAGAELAGIGVVADRIDCLTLTSWRQLGTSMSLRARAREMRGMIDVARYERAMARWVATTVVVGEDDARWLRRVSGGRVEVVANGVAMPSRTSVARTTQPSVVFSGVMAYGPNIVAVEYFAREVWPEVRRRVPTAEFHVVGRHPAPAVRALEAIPGVRVLGEVPSMADALAAAWVAVAPMRSGAGIKNKILEAWAAGTPVVMTPLAANGLAMHAPFDQLIGHSAGELAALVGDLLADPARQAALGAASRELAEREHTWGAAGARFDELLREAAQAR